MVTEQTKDDLLEVLYRRGCKDRKGVFLLEAKSDFRQWDDDTFRNTIQALMDDNLINVPNQRGYAFFSLDGFRRMEKRLSQPSTVTNNTVIAGTITNATIQQAGPHATIVQDQAESSPKRVFTRDHMTVPPSLKDPGTYQRFARYHLIYSLVGQIFGLVCIVGGIVLCLHQVTGSTSWTAKFMGAESNISDAAPGVILFIVGLLVVFVTRFTIKTEKQRPEMPTNQKSNEVGNHAK